MACALSSCSASSDPHFHRSWLKHCSSSSGCSRRIPKSILCLGALIKVLSEVWSSRETKSCPEKKKRWGSAIGKRSHELQYQDWKSHWLLSRCVCIVRIQDNKDDKIQTDIHTFMHWWILALACAKSFQLISSSQLVMHSSYAICFDLLFLLCKRGKSPQEADSINTQVPTNYWVGHTTASSSNFYSRTSKTYSLLFFGFISYCCSMQDYFLKLVQWKLMTIDLLSKCFLSVSL